MLPPVAAVCHSRLHVVTGLARSDFVPPRILTCTYRMGVNKMASVGCSPLSETDAANGTVLTKRQQLKQQRDKQRQQEFQQEKRCAACWLPLVQGVLPMVSEYTCSRT